MNILVFDDNEQDIKYLINSLDTFFKSRCFDYAIDICENTEQLFKDLAKYDLIFLDVEINGENGIDIGLKIRQKNKEIRIIIVSNYSKYLIDGYKVHADRYFIKPFTQSEFDLEFENIVNNYFVDYEGFNDEKISNKKLYFKDILYIDFYDRKTRIHMLDSSIITTPYSLIHWETVLQKQPFSKPYKSFIINLRHISGFAKTDVILVNEELIPLSRHFKNGLDKDYLNYLHKVI